MEKCLKLIHVGKVPNIYEIIFKVHNLKDFSDKSRLSRLVNRQFRKLYNGIKKNIENIQDYEEKIKNNIEEIKRTHSKIIDFENDWTIKEITFAQKRGKRIVFVNIDQSPLEDWFELMFGTKQQVDATSPDRLNKLIKDIKKWLDIPTNEQPDIPDHQTDESHVITHPEPEPEIEGDIFPVEVGGTTFNMIRVEGGEMEIGATAEQGKEAEKNEYPAHRITCQTFYMSQFPITQNLWETVMGYNKAKYKEKEDKLSSDLEELKRTLGVSTLTTAALLALPAGLLMSAGLAYGANKARKWLAENLGDDTAKFGNVKGHYPIENITYEEALEFVNRLSQMTHLQFSLPTEDEWEYAARGGRQSRGTKYAGSNSIDEVAWYRDNADGTTHPVGEKKPNELGLYDMCGNVWEWTGSFVWAQNRGGRRCLYPSRWQLVA